MADPFDSPGAPSHQAWTAATIDDRRGWYCRLPAGARAGLARASRALCAGPRPLTERPVGPDLLAGWTEALDPVRQDLDHGRGFAILDSLPGDGADGALAAYWLLGHALGRPVAQNVAGTLLYDVRDYGEDVARGARFSVTRGESGFHTDNSFGDDVVDYVGLLCLRPARSGGVNHLVNGQAVYDELATHHPAELATLQRPFHVDRRGGVRPGEGPTALHPVLWRDARGLTYRYLRHWIEAGHQKAAEMLTPAQVQALDVLDAALRRPESRVEFLLEPGQVLLLNNRWLLHNRTAFEDYPEPERGRHFVRLGVRGREGGPERPLTP
jgi:alpha-ketoglutarate-dependent taurine dioxygenase